MLISNIGSIFRNMPYHGIKPIFKITASQRKSPTIFVEKLGRTIRNITIFLLGFY